MIGTDTPHAGRSQTTRSWLSVAVVALVSGLALVACGSDSTSPASGGGSGGKSVGSGTGGAVGSGTGGAVGTGGKTGTGGSAPAASGGSTGTPDGGTMATGTPCDATNKIFIPKCAASCHGSVGPFMPDLSSEKAVSSLVGMPQIMKCTADMTSSIVNSGSPLGGTHFLWISGATCRDQMPYGGTPLTADEIACVKSYFAAKIK